MNPLYLKHVTTAGVSSVVPEPVPVLVELVIEDDLTNPDSPLRGSAPNQPAASLNFQRLGSALITWNDPFDHNYHTRDFYEKELRQDPNGEFTLPQDPSEYGL